MKINKLILTIFTSIFITADMFAQAGYYTGDGGNEKRVLIYRSTIENGDSDGTDAYIANMIRKNLVNDLAVYSNLTVIDSSEKENIAKIQAAYESSEYDDSNAIQVGKFFQAQYCINITTLVFSKGSSKTFSIQANITDIQTGRSLGGYSSLSRWDESSYLANAHREAASELLPLLGVQLTPSGKRLLMNGASNSTLISLDTAQKDYEAITAQLNEVTRKQSQVSLEKLTAMDADAKKAELETRKQLLLQQQKNAEETVKRLKEEEKRRKDEEIARETRNSKAQKWIDKNTAAVEKKASKIRSEKMKGLTASQKITVIENEKQTLYDTQTAVQNQIDEYNSLRDAEMQNEISERENIPPRKAEIDPLTGELNRTGQKILANDIKKIREKYEKLKSNHEKTVRKNTGSSNNKLAKKINSDFDSLENTVYTVNSLKDEGLYFRIEDYDGDMQSWETFLSWSFNGDTTYTNNGTISYKEMTGKKTPTMDELADNSSKREDYYDTVDSYDSFFRMNVPYVQANLYYTIKAADYEHPSLYYINVTKVDYVNVATNDILKTENINRTFEFQSYPVIDVDFRTEKQIESAKQAILKMEIARQEREQVEVEKKQQENIQTPRYVWGGLTLLPTTWSYFKLDRNAKEKAIQTIGYTLTLGLGNYLWIGGDIEAGDLQMFYDLTKEENFIQAYKDQKEYIWTYNLTFQAGFSYMLFSHMRLNLFGEYGKIFKEKGYGYGAAIDIPFVKHGITASYSRIHTEKFGWIPRYSVGIQTVF